MSNASFQRKILIAVGIVLVIAAAVVGFVRYRSAAAHQQVIRQIGAEWQQEGLLSQDDYVKLSQIKDSVVQTRTISDQDLDWLLATMQQSQDSVVHARVLGILSTLANPPAPQKQKIAAAVAPMLQSQNELDRHYAMRVQKHLGLAR